MAPGMNDPDVLAWAARESRVVLTFDKDFGELARGLGLADNMRRRIVLHSNAEAERCGNSPRRPDHRT
jgi:predicted nuclease of predicted toxin-antitoxin system